MSKVLDNYSYPVKFIDAVWGKGLTNLDELTKHQVGSLKPGEVGCFLSHCKAYEAISQHPPNVWGLILEDDVILDNDWDTRLLKAMKQIPQADILSCGMDTSAKFFEAIGSDVSSKITNSIDKVFSSDLVESAPRLATHAIAYTPHGARNIIKQLGDIETAIDVQLYYDRVKLSRYALRKGFASQNNAKYNSTIQN